MIKEHIMKKKTSFHKSEQAKRIKKKYRNEIFEMFVNTLIETGWTEEEAKEEAKLLLG